MEEWATDWTKSQPKPTCARPRRRWLKVTKEILRKCTCILHGGSCVVISMLMNYSAETLCLIVWRRPLTFNRVYIFDFPFSQDFGWCWSVEEVEEAPFINRTIFLQKEESSTLHSNPVPVCLFIWWFWQQTESTLSNWSVVRSLSGNGNVSFEFISHKSCNEIHEFVFAPSPMWRQQRENLQRYHESASYFTGN